jgi:nucleoid DNA-binding protein
MDNQVLSFGLFTWELRMGEADSFSFIISPNGSAELLIISKRIIKHAPKLNGWDFFSAKPVNNDLLQFSLFDETMNECEVDARNWSFELKKNKKELIDLVVSSKNISHLDSETAQRAAEIVVTALLGEELKIKRIGSIKISNDIERFDFNITTQDLRDSIEKMRVIN